MKRGFTLIELLVVVLIIGILASVALPQYNRAVLRARYSEMQQIARSFADSAARTIMSSGAAPVYWQDMDIGVPGGCRAADTQEAGPMICSAKKIYCDLKNNNEDNIVCFLSSHADYGNAYVQWFSPNNQTRECWARTDNDDAQALCKSLGGVKKGTVSHFSCTVVGGCDKYILP